MHQHQQQDARCKMQATTLASCKPRHQQAVSVTTRVSSNITSRATRPPVAVENGKKETVSMGTVGKIDSGESLGQRGSERAQVISQLKELVEEKNRFRTIMDGKRKEIEPLQQALAEVQKSVGEKDVIQDQVKLIGVDLDGANKDQQAIKGKVKTLETEKEGGGSPLTVECYLLEDELHAVLEKNVLLISYRDAH
ncbi:proton pump-interactor 1-like protein [Tanacetum coccineum]|uniref:Proton pump-interactor 1-like protein n=1 Tax=Tanacetum coccineum TaxID=301880 RepID=A0ABQ5G1Q8_9ASTR